MFLEHSTTKGCVWLRSTKNVTGQTQETSGIWERTEWNSGMVKDSPNRTLTIGTSQQATLLLEIRVPKNTAMCVISPVTWQKIANPITGSRRVEAALLTRKILIRVMQD